MKYSLEKAIRNSVDFTLNENKKGALVRCVGFGPVAGKTVPVPALESCDFPKDTARFMDAVIRNYLTWFEAHGELEDDLIPALKPFLGIAEHSCFLGGGVEYGGNTSYQTPVLNDIAEWRELRFDENRPHYKLLMDCMAYLKEKSREYGYFVSLRGFDGPMDIANAIRGNDLLYDFYDDPENTKEFIDFCAEGCLWTYRNQLRYADVVGGGYISGQGLWMPKKSIGHFSEDASTLCSPAMYREFGQPATEKLLDNFDFASVHVHTLGRSCIPIFREMDKIRIYQLTDDPNQPTGLQVLKEYDDELNDVIVNLDLDAQAVKDNLELLRSHRVIVNLNARSIDEAKEAIDLLKQ